MARDVTELANQGSGRAPSTQVCTYWHMERFWVVLLAISFVAAAWFGQTEWRGWTSADIYAAPPADVGTKRRDSALPRLAVAKWSYS